VRSFMSPSFPPFPLCSENLDRGLRPQSATPSSPQSPSPLQSLPPPNLDRHRRLDIDAGADVGERLDTVAAVAGGWRAGRGSRRRLTREPAERSGCTRWRGLDTVAPSTAGRGSRRRLPWEPAARSGWTRLDAVAPAIARSWRDGRGSQRRRTDGRGGGG
jgi:hypothetical protein